MRNNIACRVTKADFTSGLDSLKLRSPANYDDYSEIGQDGPSGRHLSHGEITSRTSHHGHRSRYQLGYKTLLLSGSPCLPVSLETMEGTLGFVPTVTCGNPAKNFGDVQLRVRPQGHTHLSSAGFRKRYGPSFGGTFRQAIQATSPEVCPM